MMRTQCSSLLSVLIAGLLLVLSMLGDAVWVQAPSAHAQITLDLGRNLSAISPRMARFSFVERRTHGLPQPQEPEGYWRLVDKLVDQIREEDQRIESVKQGELCSFETNSLSEGQYAHAKEWFKGESFFPCEHNKNSSFAAAATWSRPPERLYPGVETPLDAKVTVSANDPGHWGSSLALGVTTDTLSPRCGALTARGDYVCSMTVSSTKPETVQVCDTPLTVPAGSSVGQQFALRYCVRGAGYRYIYEWVGGAPEEANRAPSVTLLMNPTNPTINDTVRLEAQATDPDDDPLVYIWFVNGQRQSAEKPEVVIRQLKAGQYTVRVLVDDGQGGMAEDQISFPVVSLMPCAEPIFFYPGIDLAGYFTEQPSMRFTRSELVDNMSQGLKAYIQEGNSTKSGVHASDVYYVAKSLISSAMPTGNEAALQQAARDLVRLRRQEDSDYRLTPGDLLYLSLKQNEGNVRDALLTCHAALYRDGDGINKGFIEREGILETLRNPAGYEDSTWSYSTPQGTSRTINPRQELGGDEQGVWYHLFGMAALEYSDRYGYASYYAAWTAISNGGLPENYTDRVIDRGFPNSGLGGGLADLAVALEDNVRANMGKAPDIVKHCINYDGIAVGSEIKRILAEEAYLQLNSFVEPMQLRDRGHILEPTGVIIYKSPLSLRIEGVNNEWFSFDQETGVLDGNTAQIYFEAFLEEDGTWGIVAVPFFPVYSMQMVASNDGAVVLALYDAVEPSWGIYEFDVRKGDQISVGSFEHSPQKDGGPLAATHQDPARSARLDPPRVSDSVLLTIVLLGLIVATGMVLVGGMLWVRNRPRAEVISENARAEARVVPVICTTCNQPISPTARFCRSCGAAITPPVTDTAQAYCPHCGQPVTAGAGFCRGCGTSLR